MSTNSWFQVDRKGLAMLIEGRSKASILFELVQNAWDTDGGTQIDITIQKLPGRPAAKLLVRDNDPEGFQDLSHAYTLFAESAKKKDPSKRGRFNIGEKFVIALCRHAEVRSTTGTVTFHEDGTMTRSRERLPKGSEFEAEIRMNAAEYDEFVTEFSRLIPPIDRETRLNGELLVRPPVIAEFDVQLPTVISDENGVLRPTKRITHVEIFEVAKGDVATIYELGIPVVETGDRYHVSVGQKVPLSTDRDNVPPSYLRLLRAAVLNHTASLLSRTEASAAWVSNALEASEVTSEAVTTTVEARYGDKRAVFDPSDREANMNLTGDGYTVIPGGAFSKAAWENIRAAGAALPSGQIAPTPRPYSSDPAAPSVEVIPREQWTEAMVQVEEITRWLAETLEVRSDLQVRFVRPKQRHWAACYGKGYGLDWNVTCLGRRWFESWPLHATELLDTVIHELAHESAENHLDSAFHEACTRLGAKLAIKLVGGAKLPHFERVSHES